MNRESNQSDQSAASFVAFNPATIAAGGVPAMAGPRLTAAPGTFGSRGRTEAGSEEPLGYGRPLRTRFLRAGGAKC